MTRALTVMSLLLSVGVTHAHAEELGCSLDDALSEAAASLLLSRAPPETARLSAAVRAADSDAVALHALLSSRADSARAVDWLRQLRARSDAELVCGVAEDSANSLVIASARAGTLSPITAAELVVRGTLSSAFDRAELVIADGGGQLTRVGVTAAALHRGVALPDDLLLPLKVQLTARGPAGPRPVAERIVTKRAVVEPDAEVVRADDHAPKEPAQSTRSGRDPAEDLSALVMQLRRERASPRVHDNRLLREAAGSYARRVCDAKQLAHELEPGLDPARRLSQSGITARLVGETIARASSPAQALAALKSSPSHLLTLLEPRFTDLGVGSARDRAGKTCFVVLLCAWPRFSGR